MRTVMIAAAAILALSTAACSQAERDEAKADAKDAVADVSATVAEGADKTEAAVKDGAAELKEGAADAAGMVKDGAAKMEADMKDGAHDMAPEKK